MRKISSAASLYRLIYCSRRTACPAPGTLDPELDAIAAKARRNNEAEGVTGALLFTGSGFAHVIEGTRDALDRIFETISHDPRHLDVTVLSFAPTARRRFPDQPMAVIPNLPPGMPDPLAGLHPDPERDRPRLTTGGDILRLLETLVRSAAEAPA